MDLLQGMAMGNPAAANLLQSIRSKSSQELRQMANNLAKERGTDLETVARQLGIDLPK